MRLPLALAALFLVSSLSAASPPAASGRPNIVFFLADDMGWRDLASYGSKEARTPQIDRLAAEGVRFAQFYSNGPECSPTRAALMTGRYQQRVGGLECAIGIGSVGRYDDAIRLAGKKELGLPVTDVSIARMLKSAGYATALSGKWHLGYEDKFSPNRHGFDHAFYTIGGGMDYFHHVEDPPTYDPALRLSEKPIKREGYFTELVADEAVQWLRQQNTRAATQPFFLYVPFTAPHSPFQGPDDKLPAPLAADSPLWKQGQAPRPVYTAMIESMDAAVGRILAVLEERGLVSNTLVVFTSDNGGTGSAHPTGLRGLKGTTFEGGIRVPCLVRWPGVLPAGSTYRHPAVTLDLTASMARAAGVTPSQGRAFDGVDILRFAETGAAPERALFWRGRRGNRTWRAVREGDLKFVSRQDGNEREEQLFDLARDSAEEKDLLAARPADAARLQRLLAAWETEVRPVR